MNNQTDVSIRFKNYVDDEKKLERYAQTLAQIKSVTDGLNTGVANSLVQSAKDTKNISKDVSTMAKLSKTAFNYSTIREFTRSINRLITAYGKAIDASTAYLENINLYQVAFEGNYKSADKFIDTMTEMYGLDESWLTRTVGIFKQLSNAMGVSAETGERLSTLLTQMSLDIASLYNVDMERASSVLQSAMAGQTKPIRGLTGGDITQATLQTTLDNLGIQRSIAELSFAEKRLIIIVSLTQQLNESIGDMGRTIESPANQIRVMNSQWDRMTRAVGNVLLPTIASILPYVNAILMVITEILNAVAIFVGYDEGEYDYFAGVADSVLELEDGLEGANASAKKLKQGLRGFDKLNVITTPTSTSSGSGTGGSNIDPDIMNAFNNAYDDYLAKLEKTEMRATKIRDAIMEWLGFTKEIDPLTGKISWKYGGLKKTFSNLLDTFSKLPVEVRAVSGLIIGLFSASVITKIGKFVTLLGTKTGLAKMFSEIFKHTKYMKTTFGGDMATSILGGINKWHDHASKIERVKTGLAGIGLTVAGLYGVKIAMDSINKSGLELTNTLGLVASGLGSVIGGASAGASIGGGTGAIIGGLVGGVSALITALDAYETQAERSARVTREYRDAILENTSAINDGRIAIQDSATTSFTATGIHQNLLDELKNITDENGKVKKGYEDHANIILTKLSEAYGVEYKLVDGQIEKYDDLIETLQEAIDKKRTQLALEFGEESYNYAIENKTKAYNELIKAEGQRNQALSEMAEFEDKLLEKSGLSREEAIKRFGSMENFVKQFGTMATLQYDAIKANVRDAETVYKEANGTYQDLVSDIMAYNGLIDASLKEDTDAVEYYTNTILTNAGVQSESYKAQVGEAKKYYDSVIKLAEEKGLEITDEVKAQANEQYNIVSSSMAKTLNHIGEVDDDMAKAWGELAQNSEESFLEGFKDLEPELQQEVIDKMYDKGYEISEELQKGIEEINPEIEVRGNTSKLQKSLLKALDTFKNNPLFNVSDADYNFAVKKIKALPFAQGGLPPVGQLFVANEQGAEFVGHLGGQTFVANQNQMMDLLDKKLGQAQGTGQKVFNFYLDESHKIATYTLDQLEEMAVTNGKPITIGM